MKSFEHDYFLSHTITHSLLMTVRAIGEFRGRQGLYRDQFPEVLETLRRVAMIQSTESSNRIEGVTVAPDRLEAIMARKSKPRDRSEQEVAGYRDVLAEIHANALKHKLSPSLILQWHKQMYRYTTERRAFGKRRTMPSSKSCRMDGKSLAFGHSQLKQRPTQLNDCAACTTK